MYIYIHICVCACGPQRTKLACRVDKQFNYKKNGVSGAWHDLCHYLQTEKA